MLETRHGPFCLSCNIANTGRCQVGVVSYCFRPAGPLQFNMQPLECGSWDIRVNRVNRRYATNAWLCQESIDLPKTPRLSGSPRGAMILYLLG